MFCVSLHHCSQIGRFQALAHTNRSNTFSLLHSFPFFISFRFIEPLQQFSHWFHISDLAFSMSYTVRILNVKLCQDLLSSSLFHFFSWVYFCVGLKDYSFLCKPRLLLTEEKYRIFSNLIRTFFYSFIGLKKSDAD